MPLNAKCFVLKAKEQGKILTDAELAEMAKTIPMAAYCVQCARRLGDKLEKFCWQTL